MLIIGALNFYIFLWCTYIYNTINGLGVRRSVFKLGLHYVLSGHLILSLISVKWKIHTYLRGQWKMSKLGKDLYYYARRISTTQFTSPTDID